MTIEQQIKLMLVLCVGALVFSVFYIVEESLAFEREELKVKEKQIDTEYLREVRLHKEAQHQLWLDCTSNPSLNQKQKTKVCYAFKD